MFEFGASHKEWITEGLPVTPPTTRWQTFRQADFPLLISSMSDVAILRSWNSSANSGAVAGLDR